MYVQASVELGPEDVSLYIRVTTLSRKVYHCYMYTL